LIEKDPKRERPVDRFMGVRKTRGSEHRGKKKARNSRAQTSTGTKGCRKGEKGVLGHRQKSGKMGGGGGLFISRIQGLGGHPGRHLGEDARWSKTGYCEKKRPGELGLDGRLKAKLIRRYQKEGYCQTEAASSPQKRGMVTVGKGDTSWVPGKFQIR